MFRKIRQAFSFGTALLRRWRKPPDKRDVNFPRYVKNLTICKGCEFRERAHCELCGCSLPDKCRWATEKCPIGQWDNTV